MTVLFKLWAEGQNQDAYITNTFPQIFIDEIQSIIIIEYTFL